MKKLAPLVLFLSVALGRSEGAPELYKTIFHQQPIVEALEKIDPAQIHLFLYSLDPSTRQQEVDHSSSQFYGFAILGKVEIKPLSEKEKLLKAFIQGVKESDGLVANCFEPRHGLRVIQGDQESDFVICYSCLSVDVHGFGSIHSFLTSGSPMTTFNQFLDQYHIAKPKDSP